MQKRKNLVLASTLILPLLAGSVYAAKPLDLSQQNPSILQSFASSAVLSTAGSLQLEETHRNVFKDTLHVRVQETFAGYPVLGADAVIHIPNGANTNKSLTSIVNAAVANNASMDGVIYQDLQADLGKAPAIIFTPEQQQKALQSAVEQHQQKQGDAFNSAESSSQLAVYIDPANKAHWVYQVTFYVPAANAHTMPQRPVMILDALTFKIYKQWDNIQTSRRNEVSGGGFGGNEKMGKLVYDGASGDLAKFTITRNQLEETCYLKNSDVTVKTYGSDKVEKFSCLLLDKDHNNVYWDGEEDAVNGGYSPANDALFGGTVIKNMYQDWYDVPVLTEDDGKPMMLYMVVHATMDNAYWDGRQMTFGDGISMFYPLTSLGVAAHEISHGFTQQHSNLEYWGQSGGMNEAFSDMAAQAAEFYAYGKNSWQIGPEIFKKEGEALRYMDKPSKDCHGKKPGSWCSIDDASQYYDGLDVHFSSGVYNRFFYLLGKAKGWDVKKAFDVMVHANTNYWTSSTTFETGACGVIKATKELGFDARAVRKAFRSVKVNVKQC